MLLLSRLHPAYLKTRFHIEVQIPKNDTFNPQQRNISIPSNIGPHFAESPASQISAMYQKRCE